MTKAYYQTPSPLGKPILDIFEIDYQEDCIHTIWHLERHRNWDFNMLNAVKYLWRAGQKDPDPRSDLSKAIEYLTWAIESFENKTAKDRREGLKVMIVKSLIFTNNLSLAIDACNSAIKEYTETLK